MWVFALHFSSSAVDMAASNLLQYSSVGWSLPCLRQNMVLMTITTEWYPYEVWSMPDVHILTLVNSKRQLYVGDCLIYYGSPYNELWSAGEHCDQIILQSLIMFSHRLIFLTYCFISSVWIITALFQPKTDLFLHALSFECTSKLCISFLNQFSVYFHI